MESGPVALCGLTLRSSLIIPCVPILMSAASGYVLGPRSGSFSIKYPMDSKERTKATWRSTDCVCFDVDSTVCRDEAIDELASFLGVGEQVAQLTRNAMQGSVTYKESLRARLNLMRPSRQKIQEFLDQHPPQLTDGIQDLVKILHQKNIAVYLVSGGFTSIIAKVATSLDIPQQNIYANKLQFYFDGEYAGFDESCHTSETGGKPKVIEELKNKHGYQRVVQIGDGVTDMEACPPADGFIGFGGNQVREKVKAGSQWFVMDFEEMIQELKGHQ